jgi:hypothetical protein
MRCIFGQFGNILDVISRRTYRLRGQAWVVFETAEEAKKALDAMQGFPFFDKPIVSAAVGGGGAGGLPQQQPPCRRAPARAHFCRMH